MTYARNYEFGSAQPWSHLDQIPACFWCMSAAYSTVCQRWRHSLVSKYPYQSTWCFWPGKFSSHCLPEAACCSHLQSLLQDLPTLVNTVLADLLTDLYCPQVRSQLGASDQDLPTLVNTVVDDPTHPLHQREGLLSVKQCQLLLCVPPTEFQPASVVCWGYGPRTKPFSVGQEFVTCSRDLHLQTIEFVRK